MKTSTILILAGCTIATAINAQTSKKTPVAKKDTLIQRDLVMEREYQPTVSSAEKILISPEIEAQTIAKQPLDFSITENPTTLVGDYNPLPVAGIRIPFPATEQFGYLRLGIGSHRSFLGDAQLNVLTKANQSVDLIYQHRSIFGDLTNTANETKRSYNNRNLFIGTYQLHLEKNDIVASLSENYNAWNYYGTWKTAAMPASDWLVPDNQWSADSKFGFSLKSRNLGQPFSYTIDAEGHIFRLGRGVTSPNFPSDEKGAREKEFTAKAQLNYDVSDLFHLGADIKMRNFTYRLPISQPMDETRDANQLSNDFSNRRWFEFAPFASMTYKKWILTGGLKLSIPTLESERVKANIMASASTELGEHATFKAKLDGGLQPQSYREGIEMNPYIDPSIRLKSSWTLFDLSGQLNYRPNRSLRLSPLVEYSVTKDMPFFYNGYETPEGVNMTYGNIFAVKYMTSNRLKIGASGLYSYRSLLTILGEMNVNNYLNFSQTDAVDDLLKANGRKAWYKPGFEVRLRADISPTEKLNFFFDYKLDALIYASDAMSFCKKQQSISNLNLGTNYKLAKDVSIFLHLNNMLDQRYEVWNAYSVHGFTAVVGGSVNF